MNVFNNVKCRWDNNGKMWVDIRVEEISNLQKAALMGGQLCVYHINNLEFFCMSYHYSIGKVNIQTFGCYLTPEQYELQVLAWNGDNYINFPEGTELILIDNLYFLKPCLTEKLIGK